MQIAEMIVTGNALEFEVIFMYLSIPECNASTIKHRLNPAICATGYSTN